jgi:hypothetical protein
VNRVGRVGVATVLLAAWSAWGQTPQKPVIAYGEITGNEVYVRSGASLNHYPVCKLSAGDRVAVIGETGEWYEIRPPDQAISYISGDYVDSADNRLGVVNGDNVRVRAGSTLPDFAELKYVVQTKLSKGAEVTILGRDADGFLRIKPPLGTSLWISRSFVEFVPGATPPSAGTGTTATGGPGGTLTPAGSGPTAASSDQGNAGRPEGGGADGDAGRPATPEALAAGSGDGSESPLAAVQDTPLRTELEAVDAAARAVLAKPVVEREFEPVIKRYRPIAEQEDDEFARRYASARIEQLTRMATVVGMVQRMRALDEDAGSKRREFLEGRARIRETLPPIPTGVDAQGELRVSALYPPGRRPARYRLVDDTGPQERTIGYVEIPDGSTIAVNDFLGRHVGVMASAKRLQSGGVNPVPIFVARDLVLLQPVTNSETAPAPD